MMRSILPFAGLALTAPAALALAAPAAAEPAACLAGQYDGGAPEIAAGLILMPNGRFRYALSYGALDEQAQGSWESDGGKVWLTSDPVRPPGFVLKRQSPAPEGTFRLALDLPDGISPQYFNAVAVLNDGRTVGSPLGFEDWVLPLGPGEAVVSVKLMLPVLDLESERFLVSPGTATEARFAFTANDLGMVPFSREALAVESQGELTFVRHGRRLRFVPTSGGCK